MAKAKKAEEEKAKARQAAKKAAYYAWRTSLDENHKYKNEEYDQFAYMYFIVYTELEEDSFGNVYWRKTGEEF